MKTPLTCVAVLALSSGALPAFADKTPTTCSLATMLGTWAYGSMGYRDGVPISGSGMESYDGQGNMRWIELWSDGYTNYTWTGVGTYTITSNCVASVRYSAGGPAWTYFVAPDGTRYYWNNNLDYGAVGGGRIDRISTALLVQ
jgi:hypothetical protein